MSESTVAGIVDSARHGETDQCLIHLQEARALDLKRALMNQYDRTTAMQVLTAILSCILGLDGHHVSVLDSMYQ